MSIKVARTQHRKVVVIRRGARGLPGGAAFEFDQPTPSAEWIINHNLGWEPLVAVLSVGGEEVEAQVLHQSDNQVRVYFATPLAGRARCV